MALAALYAAVVRDPAEWRAAVDAWLVRWVVASGALVVAGIALAIGLGA